MFRIIVKKHTVAKPGSIRNRGCCHNGKSPVTPGEVLPAAELLGEMLGLAGHYEAAVVAYSVALDRSPRRLNSLFGAGQARESLGDQDAATTCYAQIAAMANEKSSRASIEYALGL